MKPVLTLTMNPAIDLASSVENVFPEHKLRCGTETHYPGGGGINVSRAIKQLGGDSIAIQVCGGPSGEILKLLLDAENVPHRPVEIEGWTRQNITILESSTGQQFRFVMPGPGLSENEWRAVIDQVGAEGRQSDLIVASGSLPPGVPDDFYGRLAEAGRERGQRLILDTSGPALSGAIESGVFLFKPSLRELRALVGAELNHEAEQDQAALQLIEKGKAEAVVVSLGAAGVLFATSAGCERMRSPTVPVNSKVGAGDSMVAGIALGLSRGTPLRDAVRFGIAAGAAAVMNQGTELCRREDTERLFQQLD